VVIDRLTGFKSSTINEKQPASMRIHPCKHSALCGDRAGTQRGLGPHTRRGSRLSQAPPRL
jgi:hypothetical protein